MATFPFSVRAARQAKVRRIVREHTHRPRVEYRTYSPGGIDIAQDPRLKPILDLGSNAAPFIIKEYALSGSHFQDFQQ